MATFFLLSISKSLFPISCTQFEMRQIGYWDKGKILYQKKIFLSNQKEKYYSNRDQEKVKLHKGANFVYISGKF